MPDGEARATPSTTNQAHPGLALSVVLVMLRSWNVTPPLTLVFTCRMRSPLCGGWQRGRGRATGNAPPVFAPGPDGPGIGWESPTPGETLHPNARKTASPRGLRRLRSIRKRGRSLPPRCGKLFEEETDPQLLLDRPPLGPHLPGDHLRQRHGG